MMLERPTSRRQGPSSRSNCSWKETLIWEDVREMTEPSKGSSWSGSKREIRTCVPFLRYHMCWVNLGDQKWGWTNSKRCSGKARPGPRRKDATGRPNWFACSQKAERPVRQ
jgi:hypothetical protein